MIKPRRAPHKPFVYDGLSARPLKRRFPWSDFLILTLILISFVIILILDQ